ncbi:MAG: hypothetical protein ACE5JC_11425 [Candidatus Zixiibacteriota bacterium]
MHVIDSGSIIPGVEENMVTPLMQLPLIDILHLSAKGVIDGKINLAWFLNTEGNIHLKIKPVGICCKYKPVFWIRGRLVVPDNRFLVQGPGVVEQSIVALIATEDQEPATVYVDIAGAVSTWLKVITEPAESPSIIVVEM